jgi:hypothetical protein
LWASVASVFDLVPTMLNPRHSGATAGWHAKCFMEPMSTDVVGSRFEIGT